MTLSGRRFSGKKYWVNGTPVAGQGFEYTFDDIGNPKTTGAGGDQSGSNLRYACYGANSLNQYANRDVPGYVSLVGTANSSSTLSFSRNGYSTIWPSTRYGSYFWGEIPLNNSTGVVSATLSTLAVLNNGASPDLVSSSSGNALLQQTAESFTYDLDGNLTSDGLWTNTWDGENRLISMQSRTNVPAAARQKLDFTYDWMGRRIQKVVSIWSGSAYTPQSTNRFVYDGWNVIGILNETNGLVSTFTWGTDLSGSMQGAGGIGGLLFSSVRVGTSAIQNYFCFDGNGNVSALVSATNSTVNASYEYGPFGEVIRSTGPMAKVNPFAFGTYFYDWETDKYYAKNRYYDPSPSRWLSRDPVTESGFNVVAGNEDGVGMGVPDNNLYAFVANNPIIQVDPLGLAFYTIDGTWTTASAMSNPWKLYHWTKELPRWYYRGPRFGLTGADTLYIAQKVKRQVCSDYCAAGGEDFTVNLTGWSRGAVAAVWVAVLLNEEGCDCGCGEKRPIPVNWIGLFDAVNMAWTVPPPSSVPGNVAHFYHAVKTGTDQWYYPTFHFGGGTEHKVYNYRPPILSSHGDVGISDTATEIHINDAYNWIENSAVASGVKF